jgi:hypothetical protein
MDKPRRQRQFSVYVTPGQLAIIDLFARRTGKKRAELVREIVLERVNVELRLGDKSTLRKAASE